MGSLYETIISLCEERGIKGGRMCTDIGMSKGILTDLKKGRQTGISTANAQKIASYFGVSVDYLLGEENEKPAQADELSENVQALVEFVKTVPDHKAARILRAMQLILEDD